MCRRNPLYCVVPPRLLWRLVDSEDVHVCAAAMGTLLTTARLRGQREALAPTFAPAGEGGLHRGVYDASNKSTVSGKVVRGEAGPASIDRAANDMYDALGAVYDLYHEVFQRDSLDGKGLRLEAVIHFGHRFNNAFWNGERLVVGDADGRALLGFTRSLEIIGHELAHGVTEFTSNLSYHGQSGALNESMSDVFGSLVKQYALKQSAAAADWLIGSGVLGPAVPGIALRSLRAPGTAYVGDDQPSTMAAYLETGDTDQGDWGGVHRNSGIPNHAFYLVATRLGGNAWEEAGRIWYDTLLALKPDADFRACASTSYEVAGRRFGRHSRQTQEVGNAWAAVGITVAPITIPIDRPLMTAVNGELRHRRGTTIATRIDDALELGGR